MSDPAERLDQAPPAAAAHPLLGAFTPPAGAVEHRPLRSTDLSRWLHRAERPALEVAFQSDLTARLNFSPHAVFAAHEAADVRAMAQLLGAVADALEAMQQPSDSPQVPAGDPRGAHAP